MTTQVIIPLLTEIRQLIDHAKQRAATAVNAELTLLYWHVGKRLQAEVLIGERAEYGKQIIITLSQQLTNEYGKGWSERQLWLCMQIVNAFPEAEIVNTVCAELSWSHLRQLLRIDDTLKRDFYIELCRLEHWSVRQLQERIKSMLYERTAISKKPEDTIRQEIVALREQGRLSPDLAFRDPYLLDFLGLADTYAEKDLEAAIVSELQRFIIELGSDFAFLARQKRIIIDQRDYYIDLLFIIAAYAVW